jgi:hypothetical protein
MVRDPFTNELVERPQLLCVMGPYWCTVMFITFPLLILFAVWTGFTTIPHRPMAVVILWALSNALALFSLTQVSCRNPGIMYRYREPPSDSWLWNDQAATWRPTHAKYDTDCAVVVEEFDHVCPWTGTAIGRLNLRYFQLFLCFAFVSLVFNVLLLTIL